MENRFQKFSLKGFVSWSVFLWLVFEVLIGGFIVENNTLGKVLSSYLFSGFILFLLVRKISEIGIEWKAFIGDFPKDMGWIRQALLIFIVLYAFQFCLDKFVLYILSIGATETTNNILLKFNNKEANWVTEKILDSFRIVIIIPIIQEIFRCLLIRKFTEEKGTSKAIILSSIVISLFFFEFPSEYVFGIIMAILYLKTRTVLVPIMFNIIKSTLNVVPVLALVNKDGFILNLSSITNGIWIDISVVVLTALILLYYIYRNWPRENLELSQKEINQSV
ncbi:CPBP family intramembrane glutamic endopeptidase [Dendrosporobacter sp. 1207_IL3150]|uniref:CPBP family intramembrane glutamic endopeptidase n=1 Tax=Dendrosporobacter sp. 1207_IL3150 TaxID=3084054 RepID=UPI002FDA9601